MPVTVTIPDDLIDAIVERKGRSDVNVQDEEIFERLEDLIDNGFHFSAIEYPNPPDPIIRYDGNLVTSTPDDDPRPVNHYYFRRTPDNAATRTTKHGRGGL